MRAADSGASETGEPRPAPLSPTHREQEEPSVPVRNSIDLEGTSSESWRHAAEEALREAARTLRGIRRLEVLGTSARVDADGTITEYRAQVRLTFEVEPNR